MKRHELSPQELETLESYERIAGERAKWRSNVNWWRASYYYLTSRVPTGRILDLGCGNGQHALLFAQDPAHRYVGIDISPAMMNLARHAAPESDFARMNMYQLGFPSATFDGFWAAASLLHIPKSKIASVCAELRRVMKPQSIGFIAMRYGNSEEMVIGNLSGDNRFYAYYGEQEFCRVLERNGFEIIISGSDFREYDESNPHTIWLTFFVRFPEV